MLVPGVRHTSHLQIGKPWSDAAALKSKPWQLPRCGACQPPLSGQSQRLSLGQPEVAGPRPLGRTLLGLAGADRFGAFGRILSPARTPAPKAHRSGPADDQAIPLMVSLPNHAGCPTVPWYWWAIVVTPSPYRSHGAGSGPAPLRPIAAPARYLHHPIAVGCWPRRTGANPSAPARTGVHP